MTAFKKIFFSELDKHDSFAVSWTNFSTSIPKLEYKGPVTLSHKIAAINTHLREYDAKYSWPSWPTSGKNQKSSGTSSIMFNTEEGMMAFLLRWA